MIILIISEPRSGSTNFANWFHNHNNIEIIFEPITNKNLKWFKNGEPISMWKKNGDIMLIKETVNLDDYDFSNLISIADKIIFLYRENMNQQLLSYTNARKNNSWDKYWDINSISNQDLENYREELSKIKDNYSKIKKNIIDKPIYEISYEDLYNRNKIKDVIKFLDIKIEGTFPYGNKLGVAKKLI